MRRNRTLTLLIVLLFESFIYFTSLTANASEGATAFQQNCSRCHHSAERFSTTADKIATLLSDGSISKHRFTLDDNTIQLIVDYIKQQQK